MAQLVIEGPGEPVIHELTTGVTTIGRHPESSVVVEDVSVSSHHASITLENGKCLLRDLNSANGTKVGDQPIKEVELRDGDTISFGGVECHFIIQAIAPEPAQLPVNQHDNTKTVVKCPVCDTEWELDFEEAQDTIFNCPDCDWPIPISGGGEGEASEYYLFLNEQQLGPYTVGQLRSMWQAGTVTSQTQYCYEGAESWRPLSELSSMLEPQPPVELSYAMAFVIPFVGIIMGIYILTKDRVGHAICVIVISLLMMGFWWGFWIGFFDAFFRH
jgi:hypothetical protein